MKKGIDISYCQQNIDFAKVKKAGIDFAVIRTGYMNKTDTEFYDHINGALKAGIDVGVYCYQMAKTKEEAIEEAKHCIETIKGYQLNYPVFYDMEDSRLLGLSNAQRTEIALTFLKTIRDADYYPAIYTTPSWLINYIDKEKLKDYDIWLAAWTGSPAIPTKYDYSQKMWQWGNGKVDGISGIVDGNICYVDYPEIIAKSGLNGYGCEYGKEKWRLKVPANIRLRPSANSMSFAKCNAGDVFTILKGCDVESDGYMWKKAVKGNSYGWIADEYLERF